MSTVDRIKNVIESELEDPQFNHLSGHAWELFEQWQDSDHSREDFCKTNVMPAIQSLKKNQRKIARKLLSAIKDNIAHDATNLALEHLRQRRSANAMREEMLEVYELIERIGRGVVYFGSARTKPGDVYYEEIRELSREVALLLDCPTWTGAGPGQMDAPLNGALEAQKPRAGIKIHIPKENNTNAFEQEISKCLNGEDDVVECKFFGPRKVGLVDAGMRSSEKDRTAFIFGPGGFGTLDEYFEMLTLCQLKKLGSNHKVPIILMNYRGFYDKQLEAFDVYLQEGTISAKDLELTQVFKTNEEALNYLADFYEIPDEQRSYQERLMIREKTAN